MTTIRHIPWAEQPPDPLDIDWSNPITRGLVTLQTGSNTTGWSNNGTIIVPTRNGLARNFTSASSQYLSRSLTVTYPLTMFALARASNDAVTRALVSVGDGGTNRHMLYLGSSSDLLLFSGDSPSQWGSGATTYPGTTQWRTYVGVVRGSANRQGYVNGISPAAANTTTKTVTASSTVAVGAYWNAGAPVAGYYWPGDIAIAGVFNRALSDSEIVSLSENPWQLFTPYTQILLFSVLSGAYTLNAETGIYTVTGNDATLLKGLVLNAENGSYTLTGNDATLVYNKLLNASSGSYSVTGADANLIYTPGAGAYTLNAESGAYVLTGSDVTFAYSGGLVTLKAGSWIRYRIIT